MNSQDPTTDYWKAHLTTAQQGREAFKAFLHSIAGNEHVVTTEITNRRTVPIEFTLEPLGESYDMPPGATYEVVAVTHKEHDLEIEVTDEGITVYLNYLGWGDVFHNGVVINPGNPQT